MKSLCLWILVRVRRGDDVAVQSLVEIEQLAFAIQLADVLILQ